VADAKLLKMKSGWYVVDITKKEVLGPFEDKSTALDAFVKGKKG
jgi:hypothetical protein